MKENPAYTQTINLIGRVSLVAQHPASAVSSWLRMLVATQSPVPPECRLERPRPADLKLS
jgi:hypothetical protein